MTTNEILEHAKKYYPIGTVFKCLNDQQVCTVADDYKDPNKNQWLNNQRFIIRKKEGTIFGAYIYKDGKWAEIVSKSEEKTKEKTQFEVGKWYKRDTGSFIKFKELKDNIFVSSEAIIATENYKYENREDCYGCVFVSNNKYTLLTDLSEIQQYLPEGHPDKIKSMDINEFKKGDYIVTLDVKDISTYCAKKNYCFKQKNNNSYVEPQIDLSGSRSNSNTFLTFDKKSSLINWRYATPEEIAEYDRLGKPYDVTTLQKKEEKKSLVGRYLKALVDYPSAGMVKKGEYGKIIDNKHADFPSHKSYACEKAISMLSDSNTIYDGRYELMPEGFDPTKKEVKEEIPEYVECVSYFSEKETKGKIYNTKKDKPEKSSDLTWEKILIDCQRLKDGCFKPSTKEAYDRQQKDLGMWNGEVKEKWIPKVGDWVCYKHKNISLSKQYAEQIVDFHNDKTMKLKGRESEHCFITNYRKAEPHEIPKENNTIKKTKPEIDSWCVKATKENQELLKQNRQFFKTSTPYQFRDFGYYYGITKEGKFDIFNDSLNFDKVLTTEEFCKKFNITQSSKCELLDTFEVTLIDKMKAFQEKYNELQYQIQEDLVKSEEKPQWLENLNTIWPQTVKKQSNRIEVKLIPVKKLIKN